MRLAARLEAMITDPVYEGKSMRALIDLVSSGEIERSSNVLYAHLGGQPAINGYAALFPADFCARRLSAIRSARLGRSDDAPGSEVDQSPC